MVNFSMEKKIIVAFMCFTYNISKAKGQHYNMTGSSKFALLGEDFTWTCKMFTPPGQKAPVIAFHRDNLLCANIAYYRGNCIVDIANYKYLYGCMSESLVTLTIPAQNMTKNEEKSVWSCEYYFNSNYRSPEVILNIASKPKPDATNITLGVTDSTGIDFSVTVIAYPKPRFELIHENGTNNLKNSVARNDVYNFTIHYKEINVRPEDYGKYHLIVSNPYGEATILIQVFPQRKPDSPRSVALSCGVTSARIHWVSSFNGGDPQTFTVVTFNVRYGTSYSERIQDMGENIVHFKNIQNLQSSTAYQFYVSAQNRHGNSSSEKIFCTTEYQDTGSPRTVVIAGGIGGTLTVTVIVLVIVFLVRRRYNCICVIQKRNENKAVTKENDTPYYSTIAEQENSERNVYENLQSPCHSEKYHANKSKRKELKTNGLTTQISEDSTTKPAAEYVNTSFMK